MQFLRRTAACLVSAGLAWTLGSPAASASNWSTPARTGGSAQSQAQTLPSPPSGVAASCKSATSTIVIVSWSATVHASSYTVYVSATSSTAGFVQAASGVTGTSWTSSSLSTGSYWFDVTATVGTNWVSAHSAATTKASVAKNSCVVG